MIAWYRCTLAALFALMLFPALLPAQPNDPDEDEDRYEFEYEEEEDKETAEDREAALLRYAQQMMYAYRTEGEHETPKSRELFFYGMRSYPFGKIPQNARLNALGQTEKMQAYGDAFSPLADDAWRQIGPLNVGGRIRSIAVHPTDGQTLWIGAADGGVWKSTDRGESWTPKMDNTNAIAMGAVAVDPGNPDILYAGTGEMSSNVDAYNGAGIFKSTDGGETWRVLGLTNVGAFSRIAVHPSNGQIIWATATKNNGGFYKSTDGGLTWRRTLELAVADLTVNPQNPNRLWIGLMHGGIMESLDGGETFEERNNGIGPGGTEINRMSIRVAPSEPSILYALAYELSGGTSLSRIYKSTDNGRNWGLIYNSRFDFLANSGGSQGWYNNVIAVKPDDPNTVIAGGVYAMRTTTGDTAWSFTGSNMHADQHTIAFDPANPDRLYVGNDGGMYRSENGGEKFTPISTGLAVTQFYDLEIDQRKENMNYGGTQDNGTLTQASTLSGDIYAGDGFFVALDPADTTIIYVEREYGQIFRLDGMGAGGINIGRTIPQGPNYALWSAPMGLDPKDRNRLYSGRHRLYVNTDPLGDEEWEAISPEVPGFISAFGISPVGSDVIYIGSAQGVVMRTTNRGENWTDMTFGRGLPNRAVTDFAFSRSDVNTVYIAYSGFFTEHIYKTTDGGETWASVSRGLPDIPVNALALHPDDENIIFAGSDIGMFISIDGGATWTVYNNGFPHVAVVDLEIHEESKTLRAATHGRSMFQIEIGGAAPNILPSITSPVGGEVWTGGTPNVIAWGGFNDPEGVRLEYSPDDGGNWRTLGEGIAGNTFRWNTVNSATITGRVRVTGMSDTTQRATSNTFTIAPFGPGAILLAAGKPIIPYGIAFDGEYLWTADFNSNRLLKLDTATLGVVEEVRITGDSAEGLDSLFTDITYYPPRESFFLHKLDTSVPPLTGGALVEITKSGQVRGVWRSPCLYPVGLAWLGTKNPDLPYFIASDRDGTQKIHFLSPENPASPVISYQPTEIVENGPRGLAADSGRFWQVLTGFEDGSIRTAEGRSFRIDDERLALPICRIPLNSPATAVINARGIEINDRTKDLWITDYVGNIYRIASCHSRPGPSDSGSVPPDTTGSAPAGPTVPEGTILSANRPNPFGETTEIEFVLPSASAIRLLVHDMNGRQAAAPAGGRFEQGKHSVTFDPKRWGLPAGAYRYSLVLENGARLSRTMMYIK